MEASESLPFEQNYLQAVTALAPGNVLKGSESDPTYQALESEVKQEVDFMNAFLQKKTWGFRTKGATAAVRELTFMPSDVFDGEYKTEEMRRVGTKLSGVPELKLNLRQRAVVKLMEKMGSMGAQLPAIDDNELPRLAERVFEFMLQDNRFHVPGVDELGRADKSVVTRACLAAKLHEAGKAKFLVFDVLTEPQKRLLLRKIAENQAYILRFYGSEEQELQNATKSFIEGIDKKATPPSSDHSSV